MDPSTWRYMLIIDWATVENTPIPDRHPLKLERWQARAKRLAAVENRPTGEVFRELQTEGRHLAERRRKDQIADLARDMAVCQALGKDLAPPWKHRFTRLVQLMGVPRDVVHKQVEQLAATVQVSFIS